MAWVTFFFVEWKVFFGGGGSLFGWGGKGVFGWGGSGECFIFVWKPMFFFFRLVHSVIWLSS